MQTSWVDPAVTDDNRAIIVPRSADAGGGEGASACGGAPLCSLMILWVTLSTELILMLKSSTYSCMRLNSSGRLFRPRTELATALTVSPKRLRKPGPCFLYGSRSCRGGRGETTHPGFN